MIRYDRIMASAAHLIPQGYIPVPQVALKNLVPPRVIHRLIHARAIPYRKIGGLYFVQAELVVSPMLSEWDDRVHWQVTAG